MTRLAAYVNDVARWVNIKKKLDESLTFDDKNPVIVNYLHFPRVCQIFKNYLYILFVCGSFKIIISLYKMVLQPSKVKLFKEKCLIIETIGRTKYGTYLR